MKTLVSTPPFAQERADCHVSPSFCSIKSEVLTLVV